MPFEFKNDQNKNKDKNTPNNTTTNSMNTITGNYYEREKSEKVEISDEDIKSLTFSLRKENVEEKNEEKENKGFVHKQEFIKMLEPGDIDMLDTGLVIVVSSVWLEVGALFAAMAGSPIVVDLVVGGVVGMVVGYTIAAIGTLLD